MKKCYAANSIRRSSVFRSTFNHASCIYLNYCQNCLSSTDVFAARKKESTENGSNKRHLIFCWNFWRWCICRCARITPSNWQVCCGGMHLVRILMCRTHGNIAQGSLRHLFYYYYLLSNIFRVCQFTRNGPPQCVYPFRHPHQRWLPFTLYRRCVTVMVMNVLIRLLQSEFNATDDSEERKRKIEEEDTEKMCRGFFISFFDKIDWMICCVAAHVHRTHSGNTILLLTYKSILIWFVWNFDSRKRKTKYERLNNRRVWQLEAHIPIATVTFSVYFFVLRLVEHLILFAYSCLMLVKYSSCEPTNSCLYLSHSIVMVNTNSRREKNLM